MWLAGVGACMQAHMRSSEAPTQGHSSFTTDYCTTTNKSPVVAQAACWDTCSEAASPSHAHPAIVPPSVCVMQRRGHIQREHKVGTGRTWMPQESSRLLSSWMSCA